MATYANPTSFLARAKEGGQIKSKHPKSKARRWKRRKPENKPSIPFTPNALATGAGDKDGANAASERDGNDGLNDARDDKSPFTNICPDCLNKGMYKAPVVKGGRSFYFYCQCSIGTAELAGVLDLVRIRGTRSLLP